MSRPYFTARYIPDRAALPAVLERGRAYFIGDEQVIVVDYGNGPITYGGKPGPQGPAGEASLLMQGQIDDLAEASIETTYHLSELSQKIRNSGDELSRKVQLLDMDIRDTDKNLTSKIKDTSEGLQKVIATLKEGLLSQINENAESVLELISFINARFEKIDKVISIVVKLVASLYPNADIDMDPEEPDYKIKTLSPNEILSCDSGRYRVESSYTDSDGAIVVRLSLMDEADQARILTLKDGDEIAVSDGGFWKVSDYNIVNEQGVITLSYAGSKYVVNTLKAGDTVEFDGGRFTVNEISSENGQVNISLTLSE